MRDGLRRRLAALIHLLTAVPVASSPEAGFRQVLQEDGGLRSRLLLEAGLIRILGGWEGQEGVFGFDSPVLTLGPLQRRGLLREAFNPLGYGPGSPVFQEPTSFRLDTAMDGASMNGVVIKPLAGAMGFFACSGAAETPEQGCFLGLGAPRGGFSLDGFLMTAKPKAGEAGTWFCERPLFPGGGLLNLGARLAFRESPALFLLDAIFSGGDYVPGGFFLQSAAGLPCGTALLELSGGLSSAGYLTPRGEAPRDRMRVDGCLTLYGGRPRARAPWELGLEYGYRIGHPAPAPGRLLESSARGACQGQLRLPLAGGGQAIPFVRLEGRNAFHPSGEQEWSGESELGCRLEGRYAYAELNGGAAGEGRSSRQHLEARVGAKDGCGRLETRMRIIREGSIFLEGALHGELKVGPPWGFLAFFGRLETRKPVALGSDPLLAFTLGWELKAKGRPPPSPRQ